MTSPTTGRVTAPPGANPTTAAAIIRAILEADANTPRSRPHLTGRAVAYLRGAADALAALEQPPPRMKREVTPKRKNTTRKPR